MCTTQMVRIDILGAMGYCATGSDLPKATTLTPEQQVR